MAANRLEPPHNLQNVISIHDGRRWINVQAASVDYSPETDSVTFSAQFGGMELRRYTMAADRVAGYVEIAPDTIRAG